VPEHTVTFRSGEQTLAGTLTVPEGSAPFPAVLLLPGSGPIDRNSDHKRMPLGITAQLAAALDTAGLATFRYDKRGVGESTGRWHTAGFYDNRDDARAALEFLTARTEVDPAGSSSSATPRARFTRRTWAPATSGWRAWSC
jgi:alpha-beta hydrolase superfamily lysophospholipase